MTLEAAIHHYEEMISDMESSSLDTFQKNKLIESKHILSWLKELKMYRMNDHKWEGHLENISFNEDCLE